MRKRSLAMSQLFGTQTEGGFLELPSSLLPRELVVLR